MKTAVRIGVGPLRGLGASLCRAAAARGLHVVIAGRSIDKLRAIAESMRGKPGFAAFTAAKGGLGNLAQSPALRRPALRRLA